MLNIIKMAYRDLGRNRRRSFFSALALGLGLALLLLMAGVIQWELRDSTDKTIRLQSGHLQVRAQSYNEDKTSLAWSDLIENPDAVAAQIASLAPVQVATPAPVRQWDRRFRRCFTWRAHYRHRPSFSRQRAFPRWDGRWSVHHCR